MQGDHNLFGRGIGGESAERPRVFLSHRSVDKPVAREIARYFEFLGLYYYFDEEDQVLRKQLEMGQPEARAVVACIEDGLAHSTHLLAVLIPQVMGSWWVPFEIGNSRARWCPMICLMLAGITPDMLPEYLRICDGVWTAQGIFEWARPLAKWLGAAVHRQYREWAAVDGWLFELGPDEDLVEQWYATAECDNATLLNELSRHLAGE